MCSSTHDEIISFGALSTESQEVKQFDNKPTSDARIDQQSLWQCGMAVNTGKPGENSFKTQTAKAGSDVKPERCDFSYEEKSIRPLALVQRHEHQPRLRRANVTVTISGEQLPPFHWLEVAESPLHDKVVAFVESMAIANFDNARSRSGSLRQLRAQGMDLRKIPRAQATGGQQDRPHRQFMMVNGRGRIVLPAFETDRDIATVVDVVEGRTVKVFFQPQNDWSR